ncbi:hypothetical protein ONZ45_g15262 [Pleurotus djamor]|nr:hypothetical protein ONZ45_g15262 [Pleurotus djamor]
MRLPNRGLRGSGVGHLYFKFKNPPSPLPSLALPSPLATLLQTAAELFVSSPESTDFVRIEVTATYDPKVVRLPVRVGHIRGPAQTECFGIFTPRKPSHINQGCTNFHVVLTVPTSITANAITLEVNMPRFALKASLGRQIGFKNAILITENMPIHAEAIYAGDIVATTSNSPITGQFTSQRSLRLASTNGMIAVHTILDNRDQDLSELEITTSNYGISAQVTLAAAQPCSHRVTINTTNGPVRMAVAERNHNNHLDMAVKTSKAPVEVEFPMFRGSFSLETSISHVGLVEHWEGMMEHYEAPSIEYTSLNDGDFPAMETKGQVMGLPEGVRRTIAVISTDGGDVVLEI